MSDWLRFLLVGGLAAALGCSGDTRYEARFASDFAPGSHVVSVFGVYKDGQMSSDAWGTIGSRVSASLGSSRCDAAYAEPFAPDSAALWSAIEDYARANGPTDDLLAQIGPAAKGDLILVLTLSGKVPAPSTPPPGAPPTASTPVMGTRGGMGRGGGMGRSGGGGQTAEPAFRKKTGDQNSLDLSASLFSVQKGESIGVLAMEYAGPSADEGIAQFATKLSQTLRGATCAGWSWDGKVDPARVRQLIER